MLNDCWIQYYMYYDGFLYNIIVFGIEYFFKYPLVVCQTVTPILFHVILMSRGSTSFITSLYC
jgi:hypothetical protein